MSSCSPDGATIPGLILLGLVIASTGGLFSKNKENRNAALIVGMSVSFGGAFFLIATGSCN
jgi:hypothetical protein